MPLKTDTIDEPNLNLTPMIDVVFLLIIFFMVGSQFTEIEHQFDVQVPTVSDAPPPPLTGTPDPLTVNISQDGTIRLNDKTRTLAELEADLKAAKENYAGQAVVIRGDGQAFYQHVMDVMAICQRAGVGTVSQAVQLNIGAQR